MVYACLVDTGPCLCLTLWVNGPGIGMDMPMTFGICLGTSWPLAHTQAPLVRSNTPASHSGQLEGAAALVSLTPGSDNKQKRDCAIFVGFNE